MEIVAHLPFFAPKPTPPPLCTSRRWFFFIFFLCGFRERERENDSWWGIYIYSRKEKDTTNTADKGTTKIMTLRIYI